MTRFMIFLGCIAMIGAAAIEDPLLFRARGMFAAIPDSPPAIEGVAVRPAAVELGKMLYFDPRRGSPPAAPAGGIGRGGFCGRRGLCA